jgi:ATP-binding cassette subfamily F protein 3
VRIFPGNYEDYLWRKQNQGAPATASSQSAAAVSNGSNGDAPQPTAPKPKKINPYKLRELESRRQQLEEEITRAENEIAECEQATLTFVSGQETMRLASVVEQRRRDLAELMSQWEEVSQALETAT